MRFYRMSTRGLMLAVVVVAIVATPLAWYVRLTPHERLPLIGILLWACMLSPLWGTAILMFLPRRLTRRLLYVAGWACVAALVFGVIHCGDRDPWQYPSAFLCMGTWSLGLACGLGHLASRFRERFNRPKGVADPPRNRLAASFVERNSMFTVALRSSSVLAWVDIDK